MAPPPAAAATDSGGLSRDDVTRMLVSLATQFVDEEPQPDTPLMQAGLDSLSSGELVRVIGAELSTPLSSTLVFDHPTIDTIADHLAPAGAMAGAAADGGNTRFSRGGVNEMLVGLASQLLDDGRDERLVVLDAELGVGAVAGRSAGPLIFSLQV